MFILHYFRSLFFGVGEANRESEHGAGRADGARNFEETIYFYGAGGAKLMAATLTDSGGSLSAVNQKRFLYFSGQLILEGDYVIVDRLSSVRYRAGGSRFDYFPYGEEKPGATAQGLEKFATYERDHTGLDYADQRYFAGTQGRFVSADTHQPDGSAGDLRGGSLYAYVGSDPINRFDPYGLTQCDANGNNCKDSTTLQLRRCLALD